MFRKTNLMKKSIALAVTATIFFGSSMSALAAEPSSTTGAVVNAMPVDSAATEVSTFSNEISGPGGAFISDETYIDPYDFMKEIGERPVQTYATGWYSLSGTTYRYEQLYSDYCVPATMQTILRYINGTTPPAQSTIAADMGYTSENAIDFINVPTYLNEKQSKNKYVFHTKYSQDFMTNRIMADITNFDVPTSIRIRVTNSSDWFYTTPGHALVCNRIKSDSSMVHLIDPGIGYSWYEKSTSDLYKVFTCLAW